MKIKFLSKELQEKIAAGEVIERPLNVIKELIENSIDANANRIVIELSKNLRTLVVRDNGDGMDKEDLLICALPHTTSKISDENDLKKIRTLGFRGEALASISRVAILTIKSKTENSQNGYFVKLKEGKVISEGIAAITKGTEVIVEDLFYNMPVRRKQLENFKNELYNIMKLIENFAIIYWNVKFTILIDQKIYKEYYESTESERIREVFGYDIARNLIRIESQKENYNLIAYYSIPGFSVKSSSYQLLIVNNRLVKSYEIEEFVKNLYKDMIFLATNPVFVLRLVLPFEEVDVNVHPNKKSVKFLNIEKVYSLIKDSFKKFTENLKNSSELRIGIKTSVVPDNRTGKSFVSLNDLNKQKTQLVFEEKDISSVIKPNKQFLKNLSAPKGNNVAQFANYRIIGQVNKTYILLETTNELVLVDQHAAEERIIYDKLISNKELKKKELVMPITLNLTAAESKLMSMLIDKFNSQGFEIEQFGDNYFVLRAIPEFLEYRQNLIKEILEEFVNTQNIDDAQFREKMALKACKSAIKANHELSFKEMSDLIQRLMSTEKPFTCPHGRPVVIKLTFGDIEKMFRRKA
ncbi:MAG: DNA mismatch repair endonuclease MutL [Candidatus Micrarchaeota archaeon]|nr:DNA mismatch repair endonuclease MutL [Candidatus Micrarchaeota archaeon]